MHLTFSWCKHPCSNSEVEALYKTLAAQCHPDKIVKDTTLKDAAQTATQRLLDAAAIGIAHPIETDFFPRSLTGHCSPLDGCTYVGKEQARRGRTD